MPAQLTGEERVLASHTILHERVTTFGDDWPASFSSYCILYGPDDARVEDDRVIAAVLRQENVGKHRRYVGTGDVVSFFVEEHRSIGICIPGHAKRRAFFSDEFFSFSSIARQHRIGRAFWKSTVGL